jgi:polyisoprenoid-binding protein YceI
MFTYKLFSVLIISLTCSKMALASTVFKLLPAKSPVEFLATGKPGFLKINGKEGKLVGQIQLEGTNYKGSFETKLDDFVTGIELRDEHMKETYLETAKYPTAKMLVDMPTKVLALQSGEIRTPFQGTLALHGVTKQIKGDADLKLAGKVLTFNASFEIELDDYNIKIPTYMGVKVANTVKVTVEGYAVSMH